jgi:DNA-binding GntR family transcriptional regulator
LAHLLNSPQKTALTDYKLDRRSFTPLYQQIKDLLLAQINRGELSAGDVIPSETRLAAAFQMSRLTVRQALYELRIEGYVIREKGRGTFIARTAVPVRII